MTEWFEQESVPQVVYKWWKDVSIEDKDLVKHWVHHDLGHKLSAYLKKLYRHEDAVVRIKIVVDRNKREQYDGSFSLTSSWIEKQLRYDRSSFKSLRDLVNHAFDHFKVELSAL